MRSSDGLAAAFDIGTTTVAASLIDLAHGERLARTAVLNPQRRFGADVVARLQAACRSGEAHAEMGRLINGELSRLAGVVMEAAGADPGRLRRVALAGNPTMEHLLLGLPVRSLAFPPYRPLFSAGRVVETAGLGWDLEREAFVFPLPGGFVGGDLVAFLFAVLSGEGEAFPLPPHQPVSLCLDLGTNAEMALVSGGRIFATSAAAGPALEGGNIACGMAALPGAIHRVTMTGDRVVCATVADGRPLGICGSGVIEAVAGMLDAGVIDPTGRIRSPGEIPTNLGTRVVEVEGEAAFLLHRDARGIVYLSQRDIREVQLAKAALRAGMEVLFRRAGIGADGVERVVLTGSFGAELSPAALKRIGVFTEKMVDICDFVRSGAIAGVEKAILSADRFAGVNRLAEAVRVIPLSGTPAFERLFLAQMDFPER